VAALISTPEPRLTRPAGEYGSYLVSQRSLTCSDCGRQSHTRHSILGVCAAMGPRPSMSRLSMAPSSPSARPTPYSERWARAMNKRRAVHHRKGQGELNSLLVSTTLYHRTISSSHDQRSFRSIHMATAIRGQERAALIEDLAWEANPRRIGRQIRADPQAVKQFSPVMLPK
jgi:hypothetical protein